MLNEVSNGSQGSDDNVSDPKRHAHHNKAPQPNADLLCKEMNPRGATVPQKLSSVLHFDVIFSRGLSPQAVFDRIDDSPPPSLIPSRALPGLL